MGVENDGGSAGYERGLLKGGERSWKVESGTEEARKQDQEEDCTGKQPFLLV